MAADAAIYDCIVVGGGVMGAATAWALAKAGQRVVLLEQFKVGHTRGSSHGDGRIYRTLYSEPEYVLLMRRSLTLWWELEAECGERLLQECGCLATYRRAEADRLRTVLERWDRLGVGYELLDPAQWGQRVPQMRLHNDELGLFQAKECGVVFASTAVLMLWERARAHGAECREDTRVTDLRLDPDGLVAVTTDRGAALRGRNVVLAGGAWNRALGASLGLTLPFTVTRELVAYFPVRPDAISHSMHDMPTIVPDYFGSDFEVYVLPQIERPVGAPLKEHDQSGVKVGLMWHGRPLRDDELTDPPDDEAHTARYTEKLRRFVADRFPHLIPEEASAAHCLYTTTPDTHFVVDRVPHTPQIVVLGGFSGHGFKFGTAIGEAAAALVLHRNPPVPLTLFALTRDTLRPTNPIPHPDPPPD